MPSPVLLTAELRWFGAGPPPEVLWERARSLAGPDVAEETRTDRYLLFDQAETAGFKLREGRLEAKLLVRRLGRWPLVAGRAAGIAEVWEKRSLDFRGETPGASDDWVDVEKRRLLWSAAPDCNAEIAALRVAGRDGWTLGFEASGDDRETALRRAADTVLRSLAVPLPAADSFSYPTWLRGRARG